MSHIQPQQTTHYTQPNKQCAGCVVRWDTQGEWTLYAINNTHLCNPIQNSAVSEGNGRCHGHRRRPLKEELLQTIVPAKFGRMQATIIYQVQVHSEW